MLKRNRTKCCTRFARDARSTYCFLISLSDPDVAVEDDLTISRRVGTTRWSVILPREREHEDRLQNACAHRRWVASGASRDTRVSNRTTPSSTSRAWLFLSAVRLQMHETSMRSMRTFIEKVDRCSTASLTSSMRAYLRWG
jgi:hypothetical protein